MAINKALKVICHSCHAICRANRLPGVANTLAWRYTHMEV